METRVRFLVVGAFSLAVIFAGFLFVFWIETSGGLSKRHSLKIEFERSAGGLRPGAAVLFNGVRVGEVLSVAFDVSRPDIVDAIVSVDLTAPLRADTRVTVESEGLLGTTAVALYGMSADSPLLGSDPTTPLLRSAASGASVIEEARQTLAKIGALIGDNADGVKDVVKNIDTFSAALARNSGRVDDVLAGLAQLSGNGPKEPPPQRYDLTAPTDFSPGAKAAFGQVTVGDVKAALIFDTQNVLARPTSDGPFVMGESKWTDTLPKLLQRKVVETLENAHYLKTVSEPLDQGAPDYQLLIDIRHFDIAGPTLEAVVELSARLVGKDGRIVDARIFKQREPASTVDGPEAVKALNKAFGMVAVAVVSWFGEIKP